jgi:hypothetical protein
MNMINLLFKNDLKNPYYIHAPPYVTQSAGILVLHKLCHVLNIMGYPAYIVSDMSNYYEFGSDVFRVSSGLITPELTSEIIDQHFKEGVTPIAVYSDTTRGDPFVAPVIVRYFLNYPGLFTNETIFSDLEIHFSYSHSISKKTKSYENVLFVPVSDPTFFCPPEVEERSGICYYAAKYKDFHGLQVRSDHQKYFEITRYKEDSFNKMQLRDLFQKSELLICYENSAVAIEAALCGCPVALIPNEVFTEFIAESELGFDGLTWGDEPDKINIAKSTVGKFRDRYISSFDALELQLLKFIEITQKKAKQTPYVKRIKAVGLIAVSNEYLLVYHFIKNLVNFKFISSFFRFQFDGFKKNIKKILIKILIKIGCFEKVKLIYRKILSSTQLK